MVVAMVIAVNSSGMGIRCTSAPSRHMTRVRSLMRISLQIKKRPVWAASLKRQGRKGSFQERRCKLTSRGKRQDAEKLNIVGRGEKVMCFSLRPLLIAHTRATHTPKRSSQRVNLGCGTETIFFCVA